MTTIKKISDFKMERYLLGELPDAEMRELREREVSDEIFAARVKKLREENGRILEECPFNALEARLEMAGKSFSSAVGTAFWLKVAAALVVALGIFSAVFMGRDVVTMQSDDASMEVAMADAGDTRIKGLDARMEVWKKTGDSAVQLTNGSEVREGDEIQLRYSVPEKCYGMLLSLDGNGTFTMHMSDGMSAMKLEPGKMTTLPYAYRLDNAPKHETFFLLTSHNSFDFDEKNLNALLKNKEVSNVIVELRKAGR